METTGRSSKQQLEDQVTAIGQELNAFASGKRWVFSDDRYGGIYTNIEVLQKYCEQDKDGFIDKAVRLCDDDLDFFSEAKQKAIDGERLTETEQAGLIEHFIGVHSDILIEYLNDESIIEPARMEDYFDNPLDIEFRIAADGEVMGVSVAVTIGGPNIYVTTDDNGEVQGFWGGDKQHYPLSSEVWSQLLDWAEEMWVYTLATIQTKASK